uniref:Uncharacterized protein n=1 Tax=Anguilla anguilla TaxID=7936 RepID=A0A0E9RVU6_ANGAN
MKESKSKKTSQCSHEIKSANTPEEPDGNRSQTQKYGKIRKVKRSNHLTTPTMSLNSLR